MHYSCCQVGESSLQTGNLYSPFMKTCRNLFLGSSQSDQRHSFRGLVAGVILWDYKRSQKELLKGPLQTDTNLPVLAMWADFLKVSTTFYINICILDLNLLARNYLISGKLQKNSFWSDQVTGLFLLFCSFFSEH